MSFIKRLLITLAIAFGGLFLTASAAPTEATVVEAVAPSAERVQEDQDGNNTIDDPGIVEQYGPITGLLGGVLIGIERIIAAFRKFKETTIESAIAERDSAKKALEDERKHNKEYTSQLVAERESSRKEAEEIKTRLHDGTISREREHREQIEKIYNQYNEVTENLHDTLTLEIHTRRKRENLLAAHGIEFEDEPPPYTKEMKREVTVEDKREAEEAIRTGHIPIVDQ